MIDELLKKGYLKKIEKSDIQVKQSLEIVKRDIESAQSMLNKNNDWAYTIAYNSILQSIKALMYSKGYRTSHKNSHITSLEFVKGFLSEPEVIYIDKMRRKRHKSVYDLSGSISAKEAEYAILHAKNITSKIRDIIISDKTV